MGFFSFGHQKSCIKFFLVGLMNNFIMFTTQPVCFMADTHSVKQVFTSTLPTFRYTGGIWNLGEHSSAHALLSKQRVIEIFKYFIIKCVHNILLYNSRVTFDPVLFLPWIPIFFPTPGCEFLGVNCKHLYFFVLFIIHKVNIRNICVKLIQINQTMIDWNHDAK